MTLEVLLLLSFSFNMLTLIISYYTLRRYKKIVKLSNQIYDQLLFTRAVGNGLEEDFKQSLHRHLRINELEEMATPKAAEEDPLMELDQLPEESTNKVMTKAESHLVKVLQAKYSLNDGEGPAPAGN